MKEDLLALGAQPPPTSHRLLNQHLGKAAEFLGETPGLWYLRDEANWWFEVKPGQEAAWLGLLRRRFEPVLMLHDALRNPAAFPLSLFLRLSHQQCGGDTLLDLRRTPRLLLSGGQAGELAALLGPACALAPQHPQAAWLHWVAGQPPRVGDEGGQWRAVAG